MGIGKQDIAELDVPMGDPDFVVHVVEGVAHLLGDQQDIVFLYSGLEQELSGLSIGAVFSKQVVVFAVLNVFHKLHNVFEFESAIDVNFSLQVPLQVVGVRLVDHLHGVALFGANRLGFEHV